MRTSSSQSSAVASLSLDSSADSLAYSPSECSLLICGVLAENALRSINCRVRRCVESFGTYVEMTESKIDAELSTLICPGPHGLEKSGEM